MKTGRNVWMLGLTFAFFWLLGAGLLSAALATSFTVTKFGDTNDGACDADCSLREAIVAANAADDPDIITLAAGVYALTIDGAGEDAAATGDLDISAPLTISGAGPELTIIDGGGLERVFDIRRGAVVIANLTIRNGGSESTIYGGGILNEADLTLSNSIVRDNIAGSGGGIANYNDGLLTVTGSTVYTNTSRGNGGGIVNFGHMKLTDSTISDNLASVGGGGIYNVSGSSLTVSGSHIRNNAASSGGGGISNSARELVVNNTMINNNMDDGIFNASVSNVAISNSTVSSNTGNGITNLGSIVLMVDSAVSNNTEHGIFNTLESTLTMLRSTVNHNTGDGITNSGSKLTVQSSTVSHNSSSSGAGIANFSSGVVTVTNSTISSNTFTSLGGGINNYSGTVTLKNTIVANNTTDDCRGVITSSGHNMDRDNTCGLTAAGDLPDANPVLGPLQHNGGDTQTHALLAGSPAIDAGDDNVCLYVDQRGSSRPIDGDRSGLAVCDIGAYEFVPGVPSTVTLTLYVYLPTIFKDSAAIGAPVYR